MQVCPNCSRENPYGVNRCRFCGEKLTDTRDSDSFSPASGRTVVFRPLKGITWPSRCVGCFATNPTKKVKLDVHPATKTSKSTKVGGVAGAFAGAIVGGIIGGIASAATGETGQYEVPICGYCLGNLSVGDIKALASHEFKMFSASPRIDTKILSREFRSSHVILTFANTTYAQAFRAANLGLVFDSVEASKSNKPTAEAKPKHAATSIQDQTYSTEDKSLEKPKPAPESPSSRQEAESGEVRIAVQLADKNAQLGCLVFKDIIREHSKHIEDTTIYFAPHIPEKKLRNAIAAYATKVSPDEVFILYDSTAFGGGKTGMLITATAFYCRDFLSAPKYRNIDDVVTLDQKWDKIIINGWEFVKSTSGQTASILLKILEDICGIAAEQPVVGAVQGEDNLNSVHKKREKPISKKAPRTAKNGDNQRQESPFSENIQALFGFVCIMFFVGTWLVLWLYVGWSWWLSLLLGFLAAGISAVPYVILEDHLTKKQNGKTKQKQGGEKSEQKSEEET